MLAGKGGDCPAEPRSAGLLARRLLELGTSAIMDLYALIPRERVRFVHLFLEALNDAPRELWHPVVVVIDEAHRFAPEQGSAESSDAVASLMSAGRKKGLCGVLATQRLSKLSKDAAAEANNLLIGRTVLDVDVARAGGTLGLTKAEAFARLQPLKPGTFFAFGPALVDLVTEVKVGDVRTSHPEAGQGSSKPPPPRERVRKVLAQLADLPAEAEAEARTVEEARERIRTLERELAAAKKAQPAPKAVKVDVPAISAAIEKKLQASVQRVETAAELIGRALAPVKTALELVAKANVPMSGTSIRTTAPAAAARPSLSSGAAERQSRPAPLPSKPRAARSATSADGRLRSGELRLLKVVSLLWGAGSGNPDRRTIATVAGMTATGGTFSTYLSTLSSQGLIAKAGSDIFAITTEGDARLKQEQVDVDATTSGIVATWSKHLRSGEMRMLQHLLELHPRGCTRSELAAAVEMEPTGGTFSTYLSTLRSRGLAQVDRDQVVAGAALYPLR